MSLGTLGSVIKFALEQEIILSKLLSSLTKKIDNETIEKLLQQSSKNIKKLKRIRRENTTEMILEPIKGLEKSSFKLVEESLVKSTELEWNNLLKNDLEKIIFFYLESAEKISFIGEVSYVFEQFKEKYEEILNEM